MPEFFGSFSQGPDGRFVSGDPRPVFQLSAPFGFKDPAGRVWPVPSGEKVDGASIPQLFWSFIGGPFEGNYLYASVVHDYYCRVKTRADKDTHLNFYYGMRAKGVPKPQADKMYWAVSSFGPKWQLVGSRGPGAAPEAAVPLPPVDLDDPATRDEALRRFEEIGAGLEASGGASFPRPTAPRRPRSTTSPPMRSGPGRPWAASVRGRHLRRAGLSRQPARVRAGAGLGRRARHRHRRAALRLARRRAEAAGSAHYEQIGNVTDEGALEWAVRRLPGARCGSTGSRPSSRRTCMAAARVRERCGIPGASASRRPSSAATSRR